MTEFIIQIIPLLTIVSIVWLVMRARREPPHLSRNASQVQKTERPTNGGVILLILAGVGGLLALGMDTSVSTSLGRVNNIGLMNQQQNYLIICGVIAVVGVVMLLRPEPPKVAAGKTCGECAETVKADAKVCRFCRHRFPSED